MKKIIALTGLLSFFSCINNVSETSDSSIEGTWKLITGIVIEKGDTAVTDYSKDISFIKMFNKTHFAFLHHDLNKGKDSLAVFVAGGGRYSLIKNSYTEYLEYCSDRNWEDNEFNFTISINGDTLIQTGVEKIEDSGIDRLNIEKYIRLE
ncbi:MAG TPA: hypothetical protein PLO24_07825 [Bacteroidales bacterium]|jgi:hypothetical protein|nr:hypothetical protein [Bacteroidales bacterium]